VYVFYGGLLLVGVWGAALRLVPGFRSWAWRTRPRLPSGSYGQVSNYGQVREPLGIPQTHPVLTGWACQIVLLAGMALLHVFWWLWWWRHPGGCERSPSWDGCHFPDGPPPFAQTLGNTHPPHRFMVDAPSEPWCGARQARRWVI